MSKFKETLLAIYLAGSIASTGHYWATSDDWRNLADKGIVGMFMIAPFWPYYASYRMWQ
jgi:hypothetical protein